jgi:hypothetical protein
VVQCQDESELPVLSGLFVLGGAFLLGREEGREGGREGGRERERERKKKGGREEENITPQACRNQ